MQISSITFPECYSCRPTNCCALQVVTEILQILNVNKLRTWMVGLNPKSNKRRN